MLEIIAGIPGRLKTLSDYLTTNLGTARAAKIDNLDTTLSSRAVASTALSTVDWTPARAALLDGVVRSIQTGFNPALAPAAGGQFDATLTIASVDVNKSIVLVQPILYNLPGGQVSNLYAYLTSATTLRFSSYSQFDSCRWTVLEFK